MTKMLHLYTFCIRPIHFCQPFSCFASDVVVKTTKDGYYSHSIQLKHVPIKYSSLGCLDQEYLFTKALIDIVSCLLDDSAVEISKTSSSAEIVIKVQSDKDFEPIALNSKIIKAVDKYLDDSCVKEQFISGYMTKEKNAYKYYVSLIERQYIAKHYRDTEKKTVCVKTLVEGQEQEKSIFEKLLDVVMNWNKEQMEPEVFLFNALENTMLKHVELSRIADAGMTELYLCNLKDSYLKEHVDFFIADNTDVNSLFSSLYEDCYVSLNK